ncbi:arylesterase [Oleidesulfovibrio alaskensis]|jgi:acyl-CoA thioesterase-1
MVEVLMRPAMSGLRYLPVLLCWCFVLAAVTAAPASDGKQPAPAGNGSAGSAARVTYILALGDSLTAGYGLESADSFPAVLEKRLRGAGLSVRVINAGVSGDTSAGGLARLGWAMDAVPGGRPDLVIVALGANDALRGLDPVMMRTNLARILEQCLDAGARVLLAGMQAPRNMGTDYAAQFDAVYPELAQQYDVPLYPFFLEGVALDPALNQPDGIHPDAQGVQVIVEKMLPHVLSALRDL